MTPSLRQYQTHCIDAVFKHYYDGGTGNVIAAMPTGTGKSLTIAGLICRILHNWPGQRIIVSHAQSELVRQNMRALESLWPGAPIGAFSAELRRKESFFPITFGTIGSMVKAAPSFGHIDVMIVDEAHLIGDVEDSMYQKFIASLKLANPHLIIIGFTATPYRMKMGLITDGNLFDHLVYDLTSIDQFNWLVSNNYLCPLISRRTKAEYDISGVGTIEGEFNQKQLAAAVSKSDVTEAACRELIESATDRHCGIIFCDSIEHAEETLSILLSEGETGGLVHSKQSNKSNDDILSAHKAGEIKWLVNKDKLTTGYDWPPLDIVGMLRHTKSPGLMVQMLGRATRPYDWENPHQYKPGFEYTKQNARVLDFARNCEELGPINDPKMPRKKGKGGGPPPIRICEEMTGPLGGKCDGYNHAAARFCQWCLQPFQWETKIVERASEAEVMRSVTPIVKTFDVKRVLYSKVGRHGQPNMLRVEYTCDGFFAPFKETICLEHPPGYAKIKAQEWWTQRLSMVEAPASVDEALRYQANLKVPKAIRVHVNNTPNPRVLSAEF